MIRGQLFVQRALRVGLIRRDRVEPKDPSFVVVGAGVAGATAAIAAAKEGVMTILVERARQAFDTQASCETRWIDPTQYDWPLSHWQTQQYPWDPALLPIDLHWDRPDYAHNLAGGWQQALEDFSARPGALLKLRRKVVLTDVRPSPASPGGEVFVDLQDDDSGSTSERASAVLIATGFGRECCNLEKKYHHSAPAVHTTEGIPFWANDKLMYPSFGIDRQPARVLISGAGDGALQDFLRVVTDPRFGSARAILDQLNLGPGSWSVIRDAQDQVDRHGNWGTSSDDDHGPLAYLQQAFDAAVSTVLADPRVQGQIASVLRAPLPEVYLVYNCGHFGRGYALNRFLALLVARYLELHGPARTGGLPLLNSYHRLVNLDPVSSHVCGPAPACYGQSHRFELARTTDCVSDEPLATDGQPYKAAPQSIDVVSRGEAEILVLHHGPRLTEIPERLLRLHYPPLARQLLPYGLMS